MTSNTKPKLSPAFFGDARKRLLQMHFESGVRHIGGNLSVLDALIVVFHQFLKVEDKFILSKGHSAGALYIVLWTLGNLHEHDLKQFHQDNTLLAGHPPAKGLTGIEFATGSLGHGLSLAAGTALSFKLEGKETRVVCMTSDGEWQEGSTWEALIFACHHQLLNLTVMVDHNNLQGFGSTLDVASMSPLWRKLEGFNIEIKYIDGHDPIAIQEALEGERLKLRVIILRTVKGHGVSFMENRMEWHYLPLSQEQFSIAIEEINGVIK